MAWACIFYSGPLLRKSAQRDLNFT